MLAADKSKPKRRSPWARDRKTTPAFQMQPRDRDIIRLVHAYRFLSAGHVQALLGGSRVNLENRCRLLWQHGFLDRPAQAQEAARLFAREIVYALARKGANLLRSRSRKIDWSERNRRTSYGFIEHLLFTNTILIVLSVGARARGYSVRWAGHDAPCLIRHAGAVVEPDAFFFLEHADKGSVAHFLEADRSTVPGPRMRERLQRYVEFWTGLQDDAELAKKWGFEHFRVLIVTESRERMDSLRRIASEISVDGSVSAWPGFLFTHRGSCLLEQPARIMGSVFLPADDDEGVSLLD